MAIARPILGLAAIVLLAGGIVMQFFIILSGLNTTPVNQIYFLQASTNGITNANTRYRNPARWTYLAICGVDTSNGHNSDCTSKSAALPFDVPRNFGTTDGVPARFVNDRSYYFYMSRFAWVFYLIALFFAVVAIFISLFALFARLGAYLTGFTTFLALFSQTLAAALMTAWVVRGRQGFRDNNLDVKIGVKAMAFTWSTWACFFLATIFFCVGGTVSRSDRTQKSSYFGRKRSTRSRGSFVDSSSERRGVKDDYD